MRRIWVWGLLVALIAGLVLSAGPVSGQTAMVDLEIPEGPPYPRGPEGSTLLAAGPVDAPASGQLCDVRVTSTNNRSVHPGNALLIRSGASSVTIPNVESESFMTAIFDDALTLDGPVSVYFLFGAGEVFSAGFHITLICNPTTTTTISETTTTIGSSPSTTVPSSTTSSSIPTGIPSGIGPVEDVATDGLSPAATWAWLVTFLSLAFGLVWVFLPKLWSRDE